MEHCRCLVFITAKDRFVFYWDASAIANDWERTINDDIIEAKLWSVNMALMPITHSFFLSLPFSCVEKYFIGKCPSYDVTDEIVELEHEYAGELV